MSKIYQNLNTKSRILALVFYLNLGIPNQKMIKGQGWNSSMIDATRNSNFYHVNVLTCSRFRSFES